MRSNEQWEPRLNGERLTVPSLGRLAVTGRRRRPVCDRVSPTTGGIAMPYIVQAEGSEIHSAVSKKHADRKDALANAVQWGSEGRKVKIIGNGRIYTAAELAISIINEVPG
jgi:hypothetical protein